MFQQPQFTPAERRFMLLHVVSEGGNAMGAFLAALHPDTEWPSEPDAQAGLQAELDALLGRGDVQTEMYVLWRQRQSVRGNTFLLDLEEARLKALQETDGAWTAAQIAIHKSQFNHVVQLGLAAAGATSRAAGLTHFETLLGQAADHTFGPAGAPAPQCEEVAAMPRTVIPLGSDDDMSACIMVGGFPVRVPGSTAKH